MPYYLRVDHPTILKQSTAQASELADKDIFPISNDIEPMRLLALIRDEDNRTGHIKFTLADGQFLAGRNTWFASKYHVSVLEDVIRSPETELITNLERDKKDLGPSMHIPGIGKVHYYEPVGNSKNFYWYELTRNGTRIPASEQSARGMIRIAEQAQIARDKKGVPFFLTSGYRPKAVNRSVGGALYSRHTDHHADAMDHYWEGASKWEMWDFYDPWWPGGLGMYAHNNIIHIDARGYRARWSY